MSIDQARIRAIADRLDGALIALDFDGTLAPIVDDPDSARPVAGAIDALAALAAAGTRIAIVTGRDARTVLRLGGLEVIDGLLVSGLHGAETWHDGVLDTIDEPAGLDRLRAQLPPLLPDGVWLEDKRLSLVLHTRRAPDPERALAGLQPLRSLVTDQGLEAHPGKQVLEIRIRGLSKATALASLLEPGTTAALYAGDDLGDLPAVEAVRDWSRDTGAPGYTIAVGEVAQLRAATDGQLDSPAELGRLLADLHA